jgi:hypothetical protein
MKSLYRVLLSLLVMLATLVLANCAGSYGCRVTFGSSTCAPSGSGIGGGGTGEQVLALRSRRLAHGDVLRLDLYAGTHALQAVHDDGLARSKSGLHHAQPVDDGAELHWPVLDLARSQTGGGR